ncbi:MAG: hypothetical protein WCZ68_01475, partial [Sedimentibacter sp.]
MKCSRHINFSNLIATSIFRAKKAFNIKPKAFPVKKLMKSVMGVSKALEELVKLMPETTHFIKENGDTVDVLVKQLKIFLISLKKQYKNKRNCI